jgi:hypothetical protein
LHKEATQLRASRVHIHAQKRGVVGVCEYPGSLW